MPSKTDAAQWIRIKELFVLAVERDVGERAAFLEHACAGDAELLDRVQALLASDARTDSFLETPAMLPSGTLSVEDEMEWMIGRRVGPYQIIREIGRGGMGTVFLADRADDQIRKQVAIKLVREEAQRLDPLPPWRATNLAWMYYLARRTDQAIVQYRKILELDPNSAVTHYSLGNAYMAKRMFEQAIAEFLKAQALDKNCCSPFLGHAYAVSGKREQARRILETLLELSRQRHVDPYAISLIYVGLGETDKAFEWFEKAYQVRSEELLLLKVEPMLDPLRADPRFQSLIRRIGLPP